MINPYSSIVSYDGDEWEDFLNKICLIDIFKELIIKYNDNRPLLKCFIRYIMYAYSKESNQILIGTDWLKNKKRIFEAAGFEPLKEYEDATVYLQDELVLKTAKRWLDFQNEETLSQILVIKDLIVEMQLSANSPIKKSSGEIDFDQKFKNACYVKDLRLMLKDYEAEFIQNNVALKEAYKEVSINMNRKQKSTMGMETFLSEKS